MVGIDDEEEINENGLLVYPNPATSRVSVRFEVQELAEYHLEIYTLLGSKVFYSSPQEFSAGIRVLNIDLSAFPGGTYFVHLIRNGQHENLSRLILLE